MPPAAPLVKTLQAVTPAVATAGNDDSAVVGPAPFAGAVTAVEYYPKADITGAATNHRRLRLVNKGQAGAGTTVVAELIFDNGVNAADFDAKALTLSAVAGALDVVAGDLLVFETTHIGTGIADPGGSVVVTLARA